MEVTATQLAAIMPTAKGRVGFFVEPLNAAMEAFEVNTPARAAMFLAQVAQESGELRFLREIWGPTATQMGYEGRADLGNIAAGDGKRYMGRGLIDVTGRGLYTRVSRAIYGDDRLVTNPELLECRDAACQSAGWTWAIEKKCNPIADMNDAGALIKVTRLINGGLNGLNARQQYWMAAKAALGIA